MKLEKIVLNENIVIYKYLYDWNFSKESILKKIIENCIPNNKTPFGNTYEIVIKCKEVNEIHTIGINLCKSLTNIIDTEYSDTNFIYLQRNNTRHSISKQYHTHTNTIVNGKQVLNDWTYCFYLQMPNNIKNNESKIAFKDINDNVVYYLPKEGEFIIFDAALQQGPEPINNAECDRITIVGTIAFNIHQKIIPIIKAYYE